MCFLLKWITYILVSFCVQICGKTAQNISECMGVNVDWIMTDAACVW
jgi:hypothetical protein